MSQAQGQPDFDLDEDLFDFAGVKREPDPVGNEEDLEQIFASFRDAEAQEELLAVPSAGAPAGASAERPAAPAPESATRSSKSEPAAGEASVAQKAAARSAAPARASEPVVERTPAVRTTRFSRSVVAIAAAVTLLNSGLAVVVLRGRSSEHDVRAVGSETGSDLGTPEHGSEHDGGAHAASPQTAETSLPEPEAVGAAHSHPALDEARQQISRGEYAAARQRVYGLLSIIDRLEDPRRGALEADCQFLIAQSLHLEALARMGGTQ